VPKSKLIIWLRHQRPYGALTVVLDAERGTNLTESSVAVPLKCNNCRILLGNFIVAQLLKKFSVYIKTEVSLVWVQKFACPEHCPTHCSPNVTHFSIFLRPDLSLRHAEIEILTAANVNITSGM
jgi:hypothetical protein